MEQKEIMKTQLVRFLLDNAVNIDGYVRGGDDTPLACVVIGNNIVLVPFNCLHVNRFEKTRMLHLKKNFSPLTNKTP